MFLLMRFLCFSLHPLCFELLSWPHICSSQNVVSLKKICLSLIGLCSAILSIVYRKAKDLLFICFAEVSSLTVTFQRSDTAIFRYMILVK